MKKEEIIYEWQYVMKKDVSDEDIFLMTDEWFADGDSLDNYDNTIFVEKYEKSKRIRKTKTNYRGFILTWFPMEEVYMVFKGLEETAKHFAYEDECKTYVDNLLKKENNDN